MSVNNQSHGGEPIRPGSSLARALDGGVVPPLSPGFADRVIAAAEARPAPLPELRRRPGRVSGLRAGRRLAVGVASFAALASAAAATGLLQQFAPSVPSAKAVWASIAGTAPAAASAPVATGTPATLAKVEIDGPIDTPEELGEAFRRADEVREGRRAERAQIIDQRITSEIERRRAAGLKVPTPERETRLRERIAGAEARREQRADQRIAERREAMERKVENGEALTRKDIVAPATARQPVAQGSAEFERLRRMSPQERRAAMQALPPAERRALIEEYRTLRSGTVPPADPTATPSPAE